MGNVSVVASGNAAGVVFNSNLAVGGIYLLLIGRDQGVYLISDYVGEVFITEIIKQYGNVSITSSGGRNLTIDFQSRGRTYALLRVN